ncbi:hypothetical protein BJ912DRAFT_17774 [Pholiota molesta]|nr:hypothetical protein BJ912DRAFT_17774 [Pholiota molesta]
MSLAFSRLILPRYLSFSSPYSYLYCYVLMPLPHIACILIGLGFLFHDLLSILMLQRFLLCSADVSCLPGPLLLVIAYSYQQSIRLCVCVVSSVHSKLNTFHSAIPTLSDTFPEHHRLLPAFLFLPLWDKCGYSGGFLLRPLSRHKLRHVLSAHWSPDI